jgi:hypothetical protein
MPMSKRSLTVDVEESTYLLVSAAIENMGITVEVYAARLLEIAASEYRDLQRLVESDED